MRKFIDLVNALIEGTEEENSETWEIMGSDVADEVYDIYRSLIKDTRNFTKPIREYNVSDLEFLREKIEKLYHKIDKSMPSTSQTHQLVSSMYDYFNDDKRGFSLSKRIKSTPPIN